MVAEPWQSLKPSQTSKRLWLPTQPRFRRSNVMRPRCVRPHARQLVLLLTGDEHTHVSDCCHIHGNAALDVPCSAGGLREPDAYRAHIWLKKLSIRCKFSCVLYVSMQGKMIPSLSACHGTSLNLSLPACARWHHVHDPCLTGQNNANSKLILRCSHKGSNILGNMREGSHMLRNT